jgi:hypothetical protein
VVDLLDESSCQMLPNLLVDRPALLLVEATQSLFHRLGARLDPQGVSVTPLSMPDMSEGFHTKMSFSARTKSMSVLSYLEGKTALMRTTLPLEPVGSRATSLVSTIGFELPVAFLVSVASASATCGPSG